MVSPALAIYWMKSTWGASPFSCSMLSLAARCRWKWCRLGEPVQRKTDHLPKPSQHQAHCPHLSQASRHQPGPGECLSCPVVQLGNQGTEEGKARTKSPAARAGMNGGAKAASRCGQSKDFSWTSGNRHGLAEGQR